MTDVPPQLADRVADWLADDPDPGTRAELRAMLGAAAHDRAAAQALAQRFSATLTFGTAGLRAPLGAGPGGMNRVTVCRAAAGLAHWVAGQGGGAVVVGRDARAQSDVFARDVAEVMGGAGLTVHALPRALPTPVLAFAVRVLGADAGVMITASHNPATDNGVKVYLADGNQVVPPADAAIASAIEAVGPVRDLPRSPEHGTVDESLVTAYAETAAGTAAPGPRHLRVVTTALHGVGGALLHDVLRRAGFTDLHAVAEQEQPDGGFPTVAFPNPEEPGALDLAVRRAQQVDADLVLALDPDADRCAVAVPRGPDRSWRVLTGDEVGGLLGEQLAVHHPGGVLATTIVSSSRLSAIARRHGCACVTTLTGFKWLARVPGLTFAYEEALGYCLDPRHVADKDGITAALAVAVLAARLREQGLTLLDGLDELDAVYGVHATAQVAVRGVDVDGLRSQVQRLTVQPPTHVAGLRVARHEDLADGVDGLPPTEGVRLRLDGPTHDGRARLVVRPSGTEPKVKAYLEVVVPVTKDRPLPTARSVADAALQRLQRAATTMLTG